MDTGRPSESQDYFASMDQALFIVSQLSSQETIINQAKRSLF